MDQPIIPEAVKGLILDKIDSVAEMESLLLLRSEQTARFAIARRRRNFATP